MTDRLPLFHLALRLDGEPCLVVGAGAVAARKAGSLLECGARVTVVAIEVGTAMSELAVSWPVPALSIERRPYQAGEAASGYRLVTAATGDAAVDRAVFEDAESAKVLVNSADDPDACSFFAPAVVREGVVSVGVSTGGVSPFVAGWVRRRISGVVGPGVGLLASIVGEARSTIVTAGLATSGLDWEGLVDGELWPRLCAGDEEGARAAAADFVRTALAADGPVSPPASPSPA